MAVYNAVNGSGVRIYIGDALFCTAKSAEVTTERASHEVYECFSTEPAAIVAGRRRYKAVLEKLAVENMDRVLSFLELEDFTVRLELDSKKTILSGCVWNSNDVMIEPENVIERLTFFALRRTEVEDGKT